MKEGQDAYGRMILDALEQDEPISEIVERDDGFMMASRFGTELYLAPFRRWPARQRRAMRLARGRVLDAGAGGGRVALHLQQRGLDVVAIDVSPLAVEACRRSGVRDARVVAVERVDESLGVFDTIVMFGNNLGLLGGPARGRRTLERLHRISSPAARILGESLDPYTTDDPAHLAYHERNRRRGRMGGQLRIRIRYREHATPWFDYLLVSRDELEELLDGTSWRLVRTIEDEPPLYVAVIEKDAAPSKSGGAASGAPRARRRPSGSSPGRARGRR
ncbi:MAG TPA: class I SAM-dependent methyltransferase [Gaiellaceae bacterium]